jgi:hypothetical protein
MKLHKGPQGDTNLTITVKILNAYGHGTEEEKVTMANYILGTSVKALEELTDGQLARVGHEVAIRSYNG